MSKKEPQRLVERLMKLVNASPASLSFAVACLCLTLAALGLVPVLSQYRGKVLVEISPDGGKLQVESQDQSKKP